MAYTSSQIEILEQDFIDNAITYWDSKCPKK
jgi:hypothetical protein